MMNLLVTGRESTIFTVEAMSKYVRINRPPSDNSIFSYVLTMMALAHHAETLGLLCYVDWTSGNCPIVYTDPEASNIKPNMWEWYFDQPHGVMEAPSDCDTWTFIEGKYPNEFRYNHWSIEDLVYKQSIVSRLLIPNLPTLKFAASIQSKYGIKPSKTIAVSYRGNDAVTDSRRGMKSITYYFDTLNRLIEEHPDFLVWIQTDDSSVLDAFKDKYPSSISIGEFETISDPSTYADEVSKKRGYQRGLEAVTKMVILSRCAVLVKNMSNLSDMAAASSHGKIIHIL